MPSFKPKTAEANFREAFERLKASQPKVLAPGTPVSQNNVAKEAGCDTTALKKARFPGLVAEIQAYVVAHGNANPPSERQRLIKARQASRTKSETISSLKVQRDEAASRLVEAHELIGTLTRRVRDLEQRLENSQPSSATISTIPADGTKTRRRAMDIRGLE
jgi:hypothetical protein